MATKKTALPVVPADDISVNPEGQKNGIKGIVCKDCPLVKKLRVAGVGAYGEVDIMFVSESPSSWSVNNQEVFYGRGGRIIRQTWKTLRDQDMKSGGGAKFEHLKKWDCYAVQCQVEEGREQTATVPKTVIDRCSCYLRSAILHKKPKVILAFGATALKALHRGTPMCGAPHVLDEAFDREDRVVQPVLFRLRARDASGLQRRQGVGEHTHRRDHQELPFREDRRGRRGDL
jgi:uracil-DNA glycosylase